jgi:hypothetical protein
MGCSVVGVVGVVAAGPAHHVRDPAGRQASGEVR